MTALRTPIIAGNWKMNRAPAEARDLVAAFIARYAARTDRTVILIPPAISFTSARQAAADRRDLRFGVQNLHWEADGAFTGELSARMAREAGAEFALAGHSERRHLFGETDREVARKAAAALDAGMTPIVCVGETLEERNAGRLFDVLARQLEPVLAELGDQIAHAVLAYEPVWAIGTGKVAQSEDARQAHGWLRQRLSAVFGADGERVPVLYGGSVKPENAPGLLATEHVDGLLVGGASLDAEAFSRIASAPAGD